jgi:hypothetical protein
MSERLYQNRLTTTHRRHSTCKSYIYSQHTITGIVQSIRMRGFYRFSFPESTKFLLLAYYKTIWFMSLMSVIDGYILISIYNKSCFLL